VQYSTLTDYVVLVSIRQPARDFYAVRIEY
jgi:hypothetical protein